MDIEPLKSLCFTPNSFIDHGLGMRCRVLRDPTHFPLGGSFVNCDFDTVSKPLNKISPN